MNETVYHWKNEATMKMVSHAGPGGALVSHAMAIPENHVFYIPDHKLVISAGPTYWLPDEYIVKIPKEADKLEIEGKKIEKIIESYQRLQKAQKDSVVEEKEYLEKHPELLKKSHYTIDIKSNPFVYLEKFSQNCKQVLGEFCS